MAGHTDISEPLELVDAPAPEALGQERPRRVHREGFSDEEATGKAVMDLHGYGLDVPFGLRHKSASHWSR